MNEYFINTSEFWVGGQFSVPNLSGGYHGILQSWWEKYITPQSLVLLISENDDVKKTFEIRYPGTTFVTTNLYTVDNVDYILNLCDSEFVNSFNVKFDIIVCQATLEHVYDPFNAIKNMSGLLNHNGLLLIHTHTPGFVYHPCPTDCLRFYPDWFKEIVNYIDNIQLLDLVHTNSFHIFAQYQKISGN